jgi:prepilin signal peptidase PulO-like enzyme (type II secretory pathway)
MAKAVAGAALGLVLANVLLALGWLPRSFASEFPGAKGLDEESEESRRGFAATGKNDPPAQKKESPAAHEEPLAPPPRLTHFKWAVAGAIAVLLVAGALWVMVSAKAAALATLSGGILVFLIGVLPRDAGQLDLTQEVLEEISAPNVRREMLKELLFLAVPVACAVGAGFIPTELPRWEWLSRVLGSVMGFLVGGGVVWLIRVGGSIAFNKEAMGMGDAHLMAGVGAVIGAPLVLLAFFTAPFLGILWAIVLKIMGKPNVLPYGPWLSVASILVLLVGNELICIWLVIMGLRC